MKFIFDGITKDSLEKNYGREPSFDELRTLETQAKVK